MTKSPSDDPASNTDDLAPGPEGYAARASARIVVAYDPDRSGAGREIEAVFREAGYDVRKASTRKDFLDRKAAGVDLVIVDATCDGKRGLRLASQYRSRSSVGIIVVQPPGIPDLAETLEAGADDVVLRPFHQRELLARVRSLLRRMDLDSRERSFQPERQGIRFDGWLLDIERRELVPALGDRRVALTTAEFNMLMVFLQQPCQVLSREHISMFALGRSHSAIVRTLDAQVARLRKKLGSRDEGTSYIKSVRNVGYLFSIRTHDVF